MRVSFQKAKTLLEGINKKDKVAIIVHDDLDGVSSGILFYDFCSSKKPKKIKVFFVNYEKKFKSDLRNFNKILIADLSQSFVRELLKKISKRSVVFYTDHHRREKILFPKNVYELRNSDKLYIPSSRTVYELVGGKKWLAVLGVLSDYGDSYPENFSFIKNFLEENNFSLDYLKENFLYVLSTSIIYLKNKKSFFSILKKLNKLEDIENLRKYSKFVKEELEKFIKDFEIKNEKKGIINFYYFEPKYPIKSFLINYISNKHPGDIFFFCVPSKREFLNISVRNQSKEYKVLFLLKELTKNLKEAKAGGHLYASSALIKNGDLENFKKALFSSDLKKFRSLK
ncbi:MAG: DHH family phosphoesterase [Candidatus Pacearchaeota archaeon]